MRDAKLYMLTGACLMGENPRKPLRTENFLRFGVPRVGRTRPTQNDDVWRGVSRNGTPKMRRKAEAV